MHPVDEFALLRSQIRELEARAKTLRQTFIEGKSAPRSNQHEVVIKHQSRKVFMKDLLPDEILGNPRFWKTTTSPVVTVRDIGPAMDDEIELIEAF